MVVGLLDEPYRLTIDQVADLTVRQVYFMYYRARDKDGRPKPLPYYFIERDRAVQQKVEMFRAFGQKIGKTEEEIEAILEEARKNGNL